MRILGKFQDFDYVHYTQCEKLQNYHDKMFHILEEKGYAITSNNWSLDEGILLENKETVIAGAFFNTSKTEHAILIHLIFVHTEFRRQGIYSTLHRLIDTLGKEKNKTSIYSYIHIDNKIMNNYVIKKIGYTPIMQVVKRKIK